MGKLWAGMAFVVLALGCAGPEVHTDYDVTAGFAAYHSYDWYAAPPATQALSEGVRSPFLDARVRQAVEAALAARHYRRETHAEPDFLVTYYPVYQVRYGGGPYLGTGMVFGGFRGPGVGIGVAGPVGGWAADRLGSIVLEIEDGRTHHLVWKAEAVDVLDPSASPEDSAQDVAQAVQKMFLQFPPRTPGS